MNLSHPRCNLLLNFIRLCNQCCWNGSVPTLSSQKYLHDLPSLYVLWRYVKLAYLVFCHRDSILWIYFRHSCSMSFFPCLFVFLALASPYARHDVMSIQMKPHILYKDVINQCHTTAGLRKSCHVGVLVHYVYYDTRLWVRETRVQLLL